jgi:hypothetical protein
MNKRFVSLATALGCAALTAALAQPALASSSATGAAGACRLVAVETLMKHTATVPELAGLKDGDCVIMGKSESSLADAWTGEYVYHPAGSRVKLTDMYVRWQDGFVMVRANEDGVLQAHVIIAKPLEAAGEPGIVSLPDVGTWILRDLGNGEYLALVDVFEHKSGDMGPLVID